MTQQSRFRPRVLVLPIAAVLIYATVEYGLQRSNQPRQQRSSTERMPAPLFEGPDARKSIFRLQGWLGRHQVLLVFFDGKVGAAADPVLKHLLEHVPDLQRTNTYVAAVSTALPSQNQPAGFPRTFALVTDLPPAFEIHRQWSRFDEDRKEPVRGVFLIDRAGNVVARNNRPVPLTRVDQEIDRLLGTTHE